MKIDQIQNLARKKIRAIERQKKDRRYVETIGRLVAAKLLDHAKIPPYRGPVLLQDALFAGELEPRIFELLPAVLLKKPNLFRVESLPEDLKIILRDIRHGRADKTFHGVKPKDYLKWIPRIGHRGHKPTVLKAFRFTQNDLQRLQDLSVRFATTETDVLKRALQAFAEKTATHSA